MAVPQKPGGAGKPMGDVLDSTVKVMFALRVRPCHPYRDPLRLMNLST